jgi:MYXO-CTERM domain-containing protein
VAYQFQIASDDLFEGVEMTGPLVEDGDGQPAWVTERDLAPGSRYYARVRAADARVYGPWSAPVVFDVGAGAAGSGERPGLPRDLGGTPQIELEVRPDQSGCQALGGSDAGLFGLLAVGLVAASRRRRRAA